MTVPKAAKRGRWPLLLVIAVLCVAGLWVAISAEWWGSDAPESPPPRQPLPESASTQPHFVGRDACAQCHAMQLAAWSGSHHDLAMQEATDATVLGDFGNATFTHSGVTTTFFQREGRFVVNTDGPDGELSDFDIAYVFGVDPLQQYLIRMPDGGMQALSISWDSRPKEQGGQRWFHLYPEEDIGHTDELHWTKPQQNWDYQCAECHSTNLKHRYDAQTRRHTTTWSEIDVSCESCHGPASAHVAWANDPARSMDGKHADLGLVVRLDEREGIVWKTDPANGMPVRSAPRTTSRETETCARCHSRRSQIWRDHTPGRPIGNTHRVALLDASLYFADGQIRDEVYEHGSFLQSRMHQAGVTCSDCHEPHSLKLRAPGGDVCLQCHQAEKYRAEEHHRHQPQSAGADCLACHMPGRNYMGIDFRRDHSLRIPRPDLAAAIGVPDACTGCHRDRQPAWAAGKLAEWFGGPPMGSPNHAEVLHAGDTGAAGAREQLLALAQDATRPGIVRASALQRLDRIPGPEAMTVLTTLLRDPDPLVRRAAVSAHESLPPELRKALLVMLNDPVRDVRLEAVPLVSDIPATSLQAVEIARRDRAIAEYLLSQEVNADRADSHLNLGLLWSRLGQPDKARIELEEALVLDPGFVPAAVNLADLHRALGQEREAEQTLRRALETRPAAAALHHALGLLLIRTGRSDQALAELQQAAELAPEAARYIYVHAVALEGTGQRAEAIRILQSLLSRQPNDREALFALASWQWDSGQREAAIVAAQRLGELEPQDPEVRALVDRFTPR